MLASLRTLLEAHPNGVDLEEAVEHLTTVFADNANDSEFELGEDHALAARKELRHWLKRGLIVERTQLTRDRRIAAFAAISGFIEDNTMTSTASRLATVQSAIETLEAN